VLSKPHIRQAQKRYGALHTKTQSMNIISTNKKSRLRQILIYIGIINSITILATYKNWNTFLIIYLLIIDTGIVLYFRLIKTLDSITIDNKTNLIIMVFSNLAKKIYIEQTNIEDLEYTYKREAITGSILGKTLRLYNKNKMLTRIKRGDYGWSESQLDKLVLLLNKNGIKRKFIGSVLKDEDPDEVNAP